MKGVPIIATGLDTGTSAASQALEADCRVRYVPPAAQMQPVPSGTLAMAMVPSVMTPVMTSVPPMSAPPPVAMSPSSPPGIEKHQIDESSPDSEPYQPERTRARMRAYLKATTAAGPADHALYNQRPPKSPLPMPTCHASERSEPATYQEAMGSEYSANWV